MSRIGHSYRILVRGGSSCYYCLGGRKFRILAGLTARIRYRSDFHIVRLETEFVGSITMRGVNSIEYLESLYIHSFGSFLLAKFRKF